MAKAKIGTKGDSEYLTTAVHIRRDHHRILRAVAHRRALKEGGRASVSKLLGELIERHRKKLETEAGAFLDPD